MFSIIFDYLRGISKLIIQKNNNQNIITFLNLEIKWVNTVSSSKLKNINITRWNKQHCTNNIKQKNKRQKDKLPSKARYRSFICFQSFRGISKLIIKKNNNQNIITFLNQIKIEIKGVNTVSSSKLKNINITRWNNFEISSIRDQGQRILKNFKNYILKWDMKILKLWQRKQKVVVMNKIYFNHLNKIFGFSNFCLFSNFYLRKAMFRKIDSF